MAVRREEVRVTADVSNFTTRLATAGASARAFAKDLDSADSRMGNLVQTGLALGPALVPIGAVAIPAITALSAGLGAAALAGGTAIIAFQGVGDALDAANKYAIEPSAANLEALQQKLQLLGPAGRDFVVFLQDLRPQLQELQNVAQAGLFPGLQDGISSLLNNMPVVEHLISNTSKTLGELARQSGDALDSPFWRDFLHFLATDAQATMSDFAHSTGNVITALASLWQAFDPLNDDFTSGLVDATQAFEDWAAGLDQTQGFQDFVAYIRDTGPQVVETLGSLGNALVQIVEAAAPLGGPTLTIIRAIADTLAAIADSPAGPVLIGVAAGVSALGRAMALAEWSKANTTLSALGGLNRIDFKAIRALPGASLGAVFGGMADDLANFNSEGTKTVQTTGQIGAGLRSLAKVGAGVAGLTLLMSDFDDGFSLSNTSALALTGTIAGPWGAAIGGGIGLAMDFASSNNELEESLGKVDTVLSRSPLDIQARTAALDQLRATTEDLSGKTSLLNDFKEGLNFLTSPHLSGEGGLGLDTYAEQAKTAADAAADLAIQNLAVQQGIVEFSQAVRGQTGVEGFTTNLDEIGNRADLIVPKLQALGYSSEQIQNILLTHEGWDEAVAGIRRFNDATDSVSGRTTSVAAAIAGLEDPLLTDAEAADALSTALDDLLGPGLDAEAAMDQLKVQLRELGRELKAAAGFEGFSKGAVANRESTRQFASDLQEVLVTQARVGASGQRLAAVIENNRKQFIAEGVAAGFSREEMRKRANEIGLTPKLVQTVFRQLGITQAEQQARSLRDRYSELPKDVQTAVKALGIDPTKAQLDSLQRKYELTDGQIATIKAILQDHASGPIASIQAKLNLLPSNKDILVTLRQNTINTVLDRHLTSNVGADGMFLTYNAAGSIRDMQPQIQPNRGPGGIVWAETGAGPWEAFISGHPAKRERSRDIADETVDRLGGYVQWFADGGMTDAERRRQSLEDRRTVSQALRTFNPSADDAARDVRSALHSLVQTLRGVYGHDAKWLHRIDNLGDRIIAQTARQDRLQHALEDNTGRLRDLRQAQAQYRSEVSGSISNDLFTGGGLAAFNLQARADRNDNRKMLHWLKVAERKGLDGPLLRAAAASGDLQFVQELAQLGRGGIHREEQLFNARARAQGRLGEFAANQVFGERVREQTHQVREMRHDIGRMTRIIDRQERLLENAVRRGAHDGIAERNRRSSTTRQAR